MEQNFKVLEDGNYFRCLQMLLPAMPQARQRDADDTLTMFITKSVKKVVIRKDGRKIALDTQSDELWTTETKYI